MYKQIFTIEVLPWSSVYVRKHVTDEGYVVLDWSPVKARIANGRGPVFKYGMYEAQTGTFVLAETTKTFDPSEAIIVLRHWYEDGNHFIVHGDIDMYYTGVAREVGPFQLYVAIFSVPVGVPFTVEWNDDHVEKKTYMFDGDGIDVIE